MATRIRIVLLAALIGGLLLDVGEELSIPSVYDFVSPAQAVIGRPGTPASVAGAARRTTRRTTGSAGRPCTHGLSAGFASGPIIALQC
jgi:hypothetical protein